MSAGATWQVSRTKPSRVLSIAFSSAESDSTETGYRMVVRRKIGKWIFDR
jgi:hypothetical protein